MHLKAIEILYSDNELIVVNKPANLLSVPGRGPDKKDCVVARLQQEFPTVRVVHRLDCATSGLMVLALSRDSHRELSRQFQDREVAKQYVADISGHCDQDEGEVDQPLLTDWPNRPRQIVDPKGKSALTRFRCLERSYREGLAVSRVELIPITGRSHQLRVHMQFLGHPILGDRLYAQEPYRSTVERLHLHAQALSITQPSTGKRLDFEQHVEF